MALKLKSLLAQTLPNGSVGLPTAIYSPTSGKGAILKSILLVNKTGSPRTTTIEFTKAGGLAMNVCPPGMSIPANASITLDSEITMSDTDQIKLYSDGASAVDAIISGMERDN